jgi:hypothetical protein
MDFKNLEDVATFMLVNLRLSRYDLQFINNLTTLILKNNTITSNQHSLFRKIVLTYRRQFTQHKHNVDELLSLTWKCNTIESSPQYTNASISILDNKIIFRSPFNKGFLTALKRDPIYTMEWFRDKRQYEIRYGVSNLKALILMSADYFNIIDYCPITTQIINSLSEYESVKYWEPTLICNNGHYYVAACNEILYDYIKDIPVTNDLKMVADYVQYGITISESVIKHFIDIEDPMKIAFAISYRVECEVRDLPSAIKWLNELGCDGIIEPGRATKKSISENFNKSMLNEFDIALIKDHSLLQSYDKPVMIHHRTYGMMDPPKKLFKIIKCVNSEPVNLGIK